MKLHLEPSVIGTIVLVGLIGIVDLLQRVYTPVLKAGSAWQPEKSVKPLQLTAEAKELKPLLLQFTQQLHPETKDKPVSDIDAGSKVFGNVQVSLKAIYRIAGTDYALIKSKAGEADPVLLAYRVNSEIAGAKLQSISSQSVVIDYQQQQIEVALFKKKKSSGNL
jgi:hypothetical protein